jgi:hypothetical protein
MAGWVHIRRLMDRAGRRAWLGLSVAGAAGVVGLASLPGSAQALPSNCVLTGTLVTCTFAYTGAA